MKNSQKLLMAFGIGALVLLLLNGNGFLDPSPTINREAETIAVPTVEDDRTGAEEPGLSPTKGAESSYLSIDDAEATLELAIKDLRMKKDLEDATSAELHQTPLSIIDAAARLADVVDIASMHPERSHEFQVFYRNCARDNEVITVTRAQCLKQYLDSTRTDLALETELISQLPVSVLNLYKSL